MNNEIFVVIDPELGWDCIVGVYTELEFAIKCCLNRVGLDINVWQDYIYNYSNFEYGIIHVKELENNYIPY